MTKATRRRFLFLSAATSMATVVTGTPITRASDSTKTTPAIATATTKNAGKLPADLFQLGVASGDPLPDSVVLWTRLAPKPTDRGGMPDRSVNVEWEMSADESFAKPVKRGFTAATPDWAHSVHVDVRGLEPGAEYFYRFRVDGEQSPVGRTRTAPAAGTTPERLRFAFASCQSYSDGYFVAHRDLAEQDLDFVAFLGDYIYENPPGDTDVRRHEGTGEPMTLSDYRNRYGQYKADEDLRAAHLAHPWIVTLDDHEVDNDYADLVPQDPDEQGTEAFRTRRAAAYQAWYEHTPVRASARPQNGRMQVYRRFDYGSLARVHVLDTRQYRTDQPTTLEGAKDPAGTMTGARQEKWLLDGMRGQQRWNILANQVPMARTDRQAGPEVSLWFDPWDGYQAQRERLMKTFGRPEIAHPLVCTGDRHFTMASDLLVDFDQADEAPMATEVTGTSISSGRDGDRKEFSDTWDQIVEESPYWKYADGQRGYAIAEVTGDVAEITMRNAPTVTAKDGRVSDGARFTVDHGRRGIAEVDAGPSV